MATKPTPHTISEIAARLEVMRGQLSLRRQFGSHGQFLRHTASALFFVNSLTQTEYMDFATIENVYDELMRLQDEIRNHLLPRSYSTHIIDGLQQAATDLEPIIHNAYVLYRRVSGM